MRIPGQPDFFIRRGQRQFSIILVPQWESSELCIGITVEYHFTFSNMTDLTPLLNELLKGHDAPPAVSHPLSVEKLNSFLKEAYTIVSLIL